MAEKMKKKNLMVLWDCFSRCLKSRDVVDFNCCCFYEETLTEHSKIVRWNRDRVQREESMCASRRVTKWFSYWPFLLFWKRRCRRSRRPPFPRIHPPAPFSTCGREKRLGSWWQRYRALRTDNRDDNSLHRQLLPVVIRRRCLTKSARNL